MFNKLSGTFMGNKLMNALKNKDEDIDSEQYIIVQQTFRCSQNSNLFDLKSKIVEFFKISKYEFHIFNDNGLMIPENDYGIQIRNILGQINQDFFREKDINPEAKRYNLFYLGRKDFSKLFERWFKLRYSISI